MNIGSLLLTVFAGLGAGETTVTEPQPKSSIWRGYLNAELGYPLGPVGGTGVQFAWAANSSNKATIWQSVSLDVGAGPFGGRASIGLGRARPIESKTKFSINRELPALIDTVYFSAIRTWGDSDRWMRNLHPDCNYLGAEIDGFCNHVRLGFFMHLATSDRDYNTRPYFFSAAIHEGITW